MTIDIRFASARDAYRSGEYAQALLHLQPLIDQAPGQPTLALLGDVMASLGHTADAADIFEQAAEAGGDETNRCQKRAVELNFAAGNEDKAQLIGLRLLGAMPEDPQLVFILVSIFRKSGETGLVDALKNRLVKSEDPEHLVLASNLINDDAPVSVNLELYAKLRRLFPNDPYIRLTYLDYARTCADFPAVEREEKALRDEIAAGNTGVLAAEEPHFAIMWLEDEALLRQATNLGGFEFFTEKRRRQRRLQDHRWGRKLKIGYVSGDLWDDHATMRLLGDVLRRHDREKFEITLFCNTPERFVGFDTGGRKNWGTIVEIRDLGDAEVEALIRRMGIDILVDLKGHTGNNRCALFNRMAAPLQAAWLGFPGSSVGVDCDYIIGDRFVLPDAAEPHFHELFCRLPETYQPNDPVTRALPPAVTRASLGLPEDKFLFASFNAPKKISPLTLDIWADILKAAPDAHFWIMGPKDELQSALSARGVVPARLHFADKMAYEPHLARAQAADIGLDTFPCNGHTTTSDILWAGVPVITARGHTFAGRVSESLLNAIGLGELVAENYAALAPLAASLAADPARVAALRHRLADNRFTAPLFDSDRFCRHLETAYRMMADRARAGKPPKAFDVPALPARVGGLGGR